MSLRRDRSRSPALDAPSRARCLLTVLSLLLAPLTSAAHAQTLDRVFESANERFFEGKHAEAITGYEQLVAAGIDDPDVYFNLATAYARAGKLGHAVLNYERALWLAPGDETAATDLKAARDLLGNRRAERKGEATVRMRPPLSEALLRPFSLDLLAGLLLALNLAFFGLLLLRPRLSSETVRMAIAIALPLLAAVGIATGLGLAIKAELHEEGGAAIVLREDAELREGPDARAQIRGRAEEGLAARLLEREGGYARVRLATGSMGWMRREDVGSIRSN